MPNARKVEALMIIPMSEDIKQRRSLLGGLSYYRKLLRDMTKQIRPITSPFSNKASSSSSRLP